MSRGVPSVDKRAGKGPENQCDNHDERLMSSLRMRGLSQRRRAKGFYVNAQDSEMIKEQHLRKVENR